MSVVAGVEHVGPHLFGGLRQRLAEQQRAQLHNLGPTACASLRYRSLVPGLTTWAWDSRVLRAFLLAWGIAYLSGQRRYRAGVEQLARAAKARGTALRSRPCGAARDNVQLPVLCRFLRQQQRRLRRDRAMS